MKNHYMTGLLTGLAVIVFTSQPFAAVELFEGWEISLGGTNYEECTTLYPTADGGCVVAGGSWSLPLGTKTSPNYGNADYWFLKVDGDGNKEWEQVYGGSGDEYPNGVQPTPDGGYLLAGWSWSVPSGNKTTANAGAEDFWLVKTDDSGNKLWERVFGGGSTDTCWCLGMAPNSYVLGGWSDSGATGNKTSENFGFDDGWIVNVDTNGNKQWEAAFGGNWYDYIYDVQPTADGGYILVGESDSDPADESDPSTGNKTSPWYGYSDGWVIKIDANGSMQWDQSYGGTNDDWFDIGMEVSDGYLIGGSSYSDPSGNKTTGNYGFADWWILKLDSNGNKLWERAYGGDQSDYLKSIQPTADGGYLLYGTSWSGATGNKTVETLGDADYWLVKIDGDGNVLWEQVFGGSDRDYAVNSMMKAPGGGYFLGGYSESGATGNKDTASSGDFDYWIIKIMSPVLSINPTGAGQVNVSWLPETTELVLQETSDLTVSNWVNSATGADNPAILPATSDVMHYRLFTP